MRKGLTAAAFAAMILLGGCATVFGSGGGSELVGRTARLVPAQGQASTLYFGDKGIVRSTFGRRTATGRWWVRNRQLCFQWARSFRECWPYPAPFRPGQTVRIKSDRGNVVRVTLR